jgi:hypothetical protein
MREERLALADSHAASAGREAAMSAAAERRWAFPSTFLSSVGRWADALAILLVTVGLCFAGGVDLWNSPFGASLPFALMPVCGVMGVQLAGGYHFHPDQPIPAHLLRVGAGALAAMAAVFSLVVITGSMHTGLYMLVCVPNAMTVFALHANYVGVVRTAARNGFLSDFPVK